MELLRRSYDPTTATWLHPDPYRGELTSPQTLGRYGYVGNNPVTATDAYGYAIMVKIKGEPSIPPKPKISIKPTTTWGPQPPLSPMKPKPTNTPAQHTSSQTERHAPGVADCLAAGRKLIEGCGARSMDDALKGFADLGLGLLVLGGGIALVALRTSGGGEARRVMVGG